MDCRRTARRSIRGMGRASYIFNSTIEGIEEADAILMIGSNPRREARGAERPHPQALALPVNCRSD
jgi:NADH dehydrogenase/NADH:ubiquinone oxidoreductase subunit G